MATERALYVPVTASCVQSINSTLVLLSLHFAAGIGVQLKIIKFRSWHFQTWKKSLEQSPRYAKENTSSRESFFVMLNLGA